MDTKFVIGFLIVIIVIVGGIALLAGHAGNTQSVLASTYDLNQFAICLKDKGATFYGAFWCPHCQATKRIFSDAKDQLPYVECSTADGQHQTPICTQKGIQGYPTWIFADGSQLNGELAPTLDPTPGKITLRDLANASNCPIVPRDGSAPIQPVTASSTATTGTSTLATSTTSKAK